VIPFPAGTWIPPPATQSGSSYPHCPLLFGQAKTRCRRLALGEWSTSQAPGKALLLDTTVTWARCSATPACGCPKVGFPRRPAGIRGWFRRVGHVGLGEGSVWSVGIEVVFVLGEDSA
jgi:hypothetical protein